MPHSIKIEGAQPDYADKRQPDSGTPAPPAPAAKEHFDKAMSERSKGGSAGNGNNDRDDAQGGQAMPSASSLLESLFESKMSAVAAPVPTAQNLEELIDGLVQRILVSDPQSGSPAEIRLQINDSVLPDTHIMLRRGPDGLLSVLLETGNASSMQTLVSARQSLREQLEKHGPADVRIAGTGESGQDGNDANRRSRGLVDYGPETS